MCPSLNLQKVSNKTEDFLSNDREYQNKAENGYKFVHTPPKKLVQISNYNR